MRYLHSSNKYLTAMLGGLIKQDLWSNLRTPEMLTNINLYNFSFSYISLHW